MDNPETLTLNDNWQQVYNPVRYEKPTESVEKPQSKKKAKKKRESRPLLIIIQIILCAIAVLSAYILQIFGGDLYKTVHDWYYGNLNAELIASDTFENFSLDNLFDADKK